jgi:hypothetical protein
VNRDVNVRFSQFFNRQPFADIQYFYAEYLSRLIKVAEYAFAYLDRFFDISLRLKLNVERIRNFIIGNFHKLGPLKPIAGVSVVLPIDYLQYPPREVLLGSGSAFEALAGAIRRKQGGADIFFRDLALLNPDFCVRRKNQPHRFNHSIRSFLCQSVSGKAALLLFSYLAAVLAGLAALALLAAAAVGAGVNMFSLGVRAAAVNSGAWNTPPQYADLSFVDSEWVMEETLKKLRLPESFAAEEAPPIGQPVCQVMHYYTAGRSVLCLNLNKVFCLSRDAATLLKVLISLLFHHERFHLCSRPWNDFIVYPLQALLSLRFFWPGASGTSAWSPDKKLPTLSRKQDAPAGEISRLINRQAPEALPSREEREEAEDRVELRKDVLEVYSEQELTRQDEESRK